MPRTKAEETPENAALLRSVGKRLRAAREALGWSQPEAAAVMRMDANHYSRVERAATNASTTTIAAAIKALGASADWVLFGTGAAPERARPSQAEASLAAYLKSHDLTEGEEAWLQASLRSPDWDLLLAIYRSKPVSKGA